MASLVRLIIECATDHANMLNVGYSRLSDYGIAWVLSRIFMEIHRMPRVNESYRLETRVVSLDRHSSERRFELMDSEGCILALIKTIWVAIDVRERKLANISMLEELASVAVPWSPDSPQVVKLRPLAEGVMLKAVDVAFSDLDINRHVTTARYIDLIVSSFSPEWHDKNRILRFDAAFMHETLAHEVMEVVMAEINHDETRVDIVADSTPRVLSRIVHTPRT